MKKIYKQLLLALVFMLVLAGGLSYLALHHVSKDQAVEKDKPLNVALVNEDEGTTYNDEKLEFGDKFAKSKDKQSHHNWNVVSRGVAESGLKRGNYDMMIIIPNDFSEKALSMDSDAPEQVNVNYKINASDNDKVQARAEQTANSILNDFNRQIIDVYFASMIGNLQDAQDHVKELVKKESEQTYAYNDAIHNPLSQYTDQFDAVKNHTSSAKDGFNGLNQLLDSYQDRLSEKAKSNKDYQSNFDELQTLDETTQDLKSDFLNQFNDYHDNLNSQDVEEQIKALQDNNQFINSQFQGSQDKQIENIASDTKKLKERLKVALHEIDEVNEELNEQLKTGGKLDTKIDEELSDALEGTLDNIDDVQNLLKTKDDTFKDRIEQQIAKLPSMNVEDVEESDLSPATKQEIENVINVTEQYNQEFNEVESKSDNQSWPKYMHQLKSHIQEQGLTMTDTVELPKGEEPKQTFELDELPDGFKVDSLTFQIPGLENETSFNDVEKGEEVSLPANTEKGNFTVKLTLKAENNDVIQSLQSKDIQGLKTWSWHLNQHYSKKTVTENDEQNNQSKAKSTDQGTTTDDANQKDGDNQKDSKDQSDDSSQEDADANQKDNANQEDSKDQSDDSSREDADSDQEDGDNQEDSKDQADNSNKEDADQDEDGNDQDDDSSQGNHDQEEKPDELVIEHNKISHKVINPVLDKTVDEIIQDVEATVIPYERLLSSYETYFGFDLVCHDSDVKDCQSVGGIDGLKDHATKDSLYDLFNNQDMSDILTDYVISQVKENLANGIKEPFANVEKRVDDYRDFIQDTYDQAQSLVEKVNDTHDEAANLNENLEETLDHMTKWRKQSKDLIDHQTHIQKKDDEEQSAVMALGSEFEPLLAESESLAKRASDNTDTADHVFKTFDDIDKQADSIQQSGTDIVEKANTLSKNMIDKVSNDQNFADDFSNVMANSRIGDRQNEDLYDFLASPVDTKNKEVIKQGNTLTPYFLVLISFVIALFTAYAISSIGQRRLMDDPFRKDKSLIAHNGLITGITACISVVEGLGIGLISARYLDIGGGKLMTWTGVFVLIIASMVLVASYLFRQLKMIGMLILLGVLSLYLFLTKALGSAVAGSDQLRAYSPLQYVETMLKKLMENGSGYGAVLLVMIGLIVLATVANLLVVHHTADRVAKDDEDAEKNYS